MSTHLEPDVLHAYGTRTLAPAEFLAADRHVASCPGCAAAVHTLMSAADGPGAVHDDGPDGPGDHLDYEQLEALVDERASSIDRELADAHLVVCASCAEALADLSTFRRDIAGAPVVAASTPWRRRLVWMGAAAALAIAVVLPRWAGNAGVQPEVSAPVTPTAAPSQPPAPVDWPAPAPPVAVQPATPPALTVDNTQPSSEVRRSGARRVGGKTFRLVAGEWEDTAFERLAMLPEVQVDAAGREALLTRLPALREYARLGARVTVVHDGTVYRFTP